MKPAATIIRITIYSLAAFAMLFGILSTFAPTHAQEDPTPPPPPTETPPPAPTPLAAAVYTTTLPSGAVGVMTMHITAGESIIAIGLGVLIALNVFGLLERWVMSIGIRVNDD